MLLQIGTNKEYCCWQKRENEFDNRVTLLSGSTFPHRNNLACVTVRLGRAWANDVRLSKGVNFFLTFSVHANFSVQANSYPHRGTRGWGGWTSPPRVFDMLHDFTFSGRPLMFSTRWGIFYGWWRCWGACDVTKKWSPSWIVPGIRNQVQNARNGDFFVLEKKNNTKEALCMILATRFAFIVEGSWKHIYFHSKMA